MLKFKRIFCPVDLSEESAEALRYAVALTRAYEAELTVCHCLENNAEPAPAQMAVMQATMRNEVAEFVCLACPGAINWEPLLVEGKSIGVVGIDIALDALQAAAVDSQRELFNSAGHMLIVSGTGVMAAYSVDASKVGKSIGDTLGADGKDVLQLLGAGTAKILQQGDLIRAVYPVSPIADSKAWGVVIDLPRQVLLADSVKLQSVLDDARSEEHTSELQSHHDLVCRLLLEKKKKRKKKKHKITCMKSDT